MLQVQLGEGKPARSEDELGRARLGWHPDMDEEEAWQAGRGDWALKTDHVLDQHEVQIVNLDGTVVAVATIRGVTRVKDGRRRFFLEGTRIKNDPRVGKPTRTKHPSRNPIAYFEDPEPTPYQRVHLLDGENDLLCPECGKATVAIRADLPVQHDGRRTGFAGCCRRCRVRLELRVSNNTDGDRSFLEWFVSSPH